MRKIIAILGTILISTILISGSAVAATYYIISVSSSSYCSYPNNAVGSPDDTYATIGFEGNNGEIILDFGSSAAMGSDQLFTIHGTDGAGITEDYDVTVLDLNMLNPTPLGSGIDTQDEDFTTPSSGTWRYVKIEGECSDVSREDPLTGPEIDAVSYET
jgi:hypothetical protein